jgi:hypothetical protein
VGATRAKVLERVRFGLAYTVGTVRGFATAESARLGKGVATHLAGTRSEAMSVVPAQAQLAMPVYKAEVKLSRVNVETKLVKSVAQSYEHTVHRPVPNPEIPKLQDALIVAERELRRLERDYHRPCHVCAGRLRIRCPDCKGRGRVRCGYCKGSGTQPCRRCKGRKVIKGGAVCPACNGTGKRHCEACNGRGWRTCRRCDGRGRCRCPHCRGTGLDGLVSDLELEHAEDRVDAIRRELTAQPLTVMAPFSEQWPYRIHFHEKRGTADAVVQVLHPQTGQVLVSEPVRQTSVSKDAVIENANPSIGLQPNELTLPSDAETRTWLIDHLAAAVAKTLRTTVANAQASAAKARAQQLSAEGKAAESVEALVDLARLIEEPKPRGAATILARLEQVVQQ